MCRSGMKPIGLRFKNQKSNPYTGRVSGELMIVHQCINCGRISSNRIAGDDNPQQIIRLLQGYKKLSKDTVDKLRDIGVKLLDYRDKQQVLIALFGYDYKDSSR